MKHHIYLAFCQHQNYDKNNFLNFWCLPKCLPDWFKCTLIFWESSLVAAIKQLYLLTSSKTGLGVERGVGQLTCFLYCTLASKNLFIFLIRLDMFWKLPTWRWIGCVPSITSAPNLYCSRFENIHCAIWNVIQQCNSQKCTVVCLQSCYNVSTGSERRIKLSE